MAVKAVARNGHEQRARLNQTIICGNLGNDQVVRVDGCRDRER